MRVFGYTRNHRRLLGSGGTARIASSGALLGNATAHSAIAANLKDEKELLSALKQTHLACAGYIIAIISINLAKAPAD